MSPPLPQVPHPPDKLTPPLLLAPPSFGRPDQSDQLSPPFLPVDPVLCGSCLRPSNQLFPPLPHVVPAHQPSELSQPGEQHSVEVSIIGAPVEDYISKSFAVKH